MEKIVFLGNFFKLLGGGVVVDLKISKSHRTKVVCDDVLHLLNTQI
jgi:hypothetical protein